MCRQYTSYVTFSHAVNTHLLLHITLHGPRMCWCASSHLHGHPCVRFDRCSLSLSLLLTLFLSVCFSYPFFYANGNSETRQAAQRQKCQEVRETCWVAERNCETVVSNARVWATGDERMPQLLKGAQHLTRQF